MHGSSAGSAEHVVAGMIAGSVTAFLMSPLDVARTRLQLQQTILPRHLQSRGPVAALKEIFRQEGFSGFFRGYSSAAVAIPLFWSTYFGLYDVLKHKLSDYLERRHHSQHAAGGPREAGVHTPLPPQSEWTSAFVHSTSAITTAILCDFITNPLWVVRTRLQSQGLHTLAQDEAAKVRYRGLLHGLVKIGRQEGVRALYKGLIASWLGATHVAVQFPLYEYLKRHWVDEMEGGGRGGWGQVRAGHGEEELVLPEAPTLAAGTLDMEVSELEVSPSATARHAQASSPPSAGTSLQGSLSLIVAATVSKFVASAATYPHEVIRARLQDQRSHLRGPAGSSSSSGSGSSSAGVYSGVWDCARKIYRHEGVRGLYSGFSVNLMRALPATAVMFLSYEHSLQVMHDSKMRERVEEAVGYWSSTSTTSGASSTASAGHGQGHTRAELDTSSHGKGLGRGAQGEQAHEGLPRPAAVSTHASSKMHEGARQATG